MHEDVRNFRWGEDLRSAHTWKTETVLALAFRGPRPKVYTVYMMNLLENNILVKVSPGSTHSWAYTWH